jgi:cysteine desulfurase/selenocysteine lyase
MSTSDSPKSPGGSAPDSALLDPSGFALPTGFPSLSQVSAWANEFFKGSGADLPLTAAGPAHATLPLEAASFASDPRAMNQAPPQLPAAGGFDLDPGALTRYAQTDQVNGPVINALSKQPLTVADPAISESIKYRPDVQSVGGPGAAPQVLGRTTSGASGLSQQASRREAAPLFDPGLAGAPSYYFLNQALGARPESPAYDPAKLGFGSGASLQEPFGTASSAVSDPRGAQSPALPLGAGAGFAPSIPGVASAPQVGGIPSGAGAPLFAGNPAAIGAAPAAQVPSGGYMPSGGSAIPNTGYAPSEGSAIPNRNGAYAPSTASAIPNDTYRGNGEQRPTGTYVAPAARSNYDANNPSARARSADNAAGAFTPAHTDRRAAAVPDPLSVPGYDPARPAQLANNPSAPQPSDFGSQPRAARSGRTGAPNNHAYDANAPRTLAPTSWQDPVGALPSARGTNWITDLSQPWSAAQSGERPQPLAPKQFEIEAIRADFPILQEQVNGRPLVWLDNAATTQKPQVVIDRLSYFYAHENSNIHRAAHSLAARATDAYETARESVRRFLNAGTTEEIIFVRGTTEGINLIAQSWGKRNIEAGDEIILSRIEHHSNIVPWQLLCAQTGARIRIAEVDDSGQIMLDQYERLFNSRTRLVSVTHVSNALGTIVPVGAMIEVAHRYGVPVVVDGAQSVCHMRVDVQQLDADFYVFSGHKVFGPTGIGAVYGKYKLLQGMPPYQGGGNMIGDVTFEKTEYQPPPARFEAGTGNIADAVGLGAALDYLEGLGLENVARHEHTLLEYGTARLQEVPGLHMIGTAKEKAAVLGFVLENVSSVQVGAALASEGIAVRAGHHCAQPALRRFGHETTVRPSLAVYNNHDDIDRLVAALFDLQSRWLR